jgi:hypothetical protein
MGERMRAKGKRSQHGKPETVGSKTPTEDPGGSEQAVWGGGEVHRNEESSNDRGAKGPQFKVNAEAARAREIDVSLPTPQRLSRCRERCRLQRRQRRVRGLSCAYARYLVRKPDAGKLHVRFDERDLETGRKPPRQISTLHPGYRHSNRARSEGPAFR